MTNKAAQNLRWQHWINAGSTLDLSFNIDSTLKQLIHQGVCFFNFFLLGLDGKDCSMLTGALLGLAHRQIFPISKNHDIHVHPAGFFSFCKRLGDCSSHVKVPRANRRAAANEARRLQHKKNQTPRS
jgi:hypothetical protein